MSDKLKRYIIIIVLVVVNTVLILITGSSVMKAINTVWKTGGVSSTEGTNNNENINNNEDVNNNENVDNNQNEDNATTPKEDDVVQNNTQAQLTLETVVYGVKIIVSSQEKINYIQYSLDDGEMQKVDVNETKYEGTIELTEGQHKLKIEVVDTNENKTVKEEMVIGANEPTVNVKSKLINEKATFIIDANDNDSITMVKIVHNGGQEQIEEVNDKTYYKEITMTDGEVNTLIVEVINTNGLSKIKKVKFQNY